MNKSQRWRWGFLLGALVCTLAAIGLPQDEQSSPLSVAVVAQAPSQPVKAALPADEAPSDGDDAIGDPFAPRGWQAAPIVTVSAPVTAAVAASPAAPAPQGPPPLPFRFVGRMTEDGQDVVYLARGDQTLVARNGEILENTYKVLGINAQKIDFELLSSGEKQTLAFPAPDS